MAIAVNDVATSPIPGQKAGTSGLRKKVTDIQLPHYIENFVQSIYNSLDPEQVKGSTIVVGGDGRYYNTVAVQAILKVSAGNGVARCMVGQNGILSTPAVSVIIREREGGISLGGILLTASHNPGGPDGDFGIKYNCENGGPATEEVTDKVYEHTLNISSYKCADLPEVDLGTLGDQNFELANGSNFTVNIIDSIEDYVAKMRTLFNFEAIQGLLSRSDFNILYDCMHGVAGPYVRAIFNGIFGVPLDQLINSEVKEDFGKGHPDPNLTYAHELVERLGLTSKGVESGAEGPFPDFGAANDGDADRNMILGDRFFVTPSDSIAVIAANYSCIPYLASGLKGIARSMPTSAALDFVCKKMNLDLYETPTGWKFFGNLMDAGKVSLCGEESFGTGSDHIREKDGCWAVLAWLNILAAKNTNPEEKVTIRDILTDHWKQFGRNYYQRYDYEAVGTEDAAALMEHLKSKFGEFEGEADDYTYTDPVDNSVSANQGLRFITPEYRVIYRLSGTGSVGATVRVYYDKYEPERIDIPAEEALSDIINWSLNFSNINAILKVEGPTVIT